ncbi:hypothetical protein DFP72DRAFT_830172, partial [Ephemerocybe angulata]
RNIMRDNSLLNMTGLPGRWLPVDLNIEHIIGKLKALLVAKGLKHTWDNLGNASAAINSLEDVKKCVAKVLQLSYQSKGHSDADTRSLVWKVEKRVTEERLLTHIPNRSGNQKMKAATDIRANGERLLKSSTLAAFNKKIYAAAQGTLAETRISNDDDEEVETLPMNGVSIVSSPTVEDVDPDAELLPASE